MKEAVVVPVTSDEVGDEKESEHEGPPSGSWSGKGSRLRAWSKKYATSMHSDSESLATFESTFNRERQVGVRFHPGRFARQLLYHMLPPGLAIPFVIMWDSKMMARCAAARPPALRRRATLTRCWPQEPGLSAHEAHGLDVQPHFPRIPRHRPLPHHLLQGLRRQRIRAGGSALQRRAHGHDVLLLHPEGHDRRECRPGPARTAARAPTHRSTQAKYAYMPERDYHILLTEVRASPVGCALAAR